MKRKDIVIDFDGTCVKHQFPLVGESIGAEPVLRELVAAGHRLILSTMRSDIKVVQGAEHKEIVAQPGNYLSDALEWFKKNNIELYGVQTNPSQKRWTSSPKAYGHLHIDDAGLGCPLIIPEDPAERPYVDWNKARAIMEIDGILPCLNVRSALIRLAWGDRLNNLYRKFNAKTK